ncbi:hypothetical protein [Streptomyces luteoverticillatus]|uniref:hypothetical protein n=1 Tax=Streptomyces luteoverticillatus TaxID=66425 RepID=UPI001F0C287F|nr:hypothetical protein [Streptomyces luteoverticillatus]
MSRQWWIVQALAVSVLAGGVAVVDAAPAWADARVEAAAPAVEGDQPTDESAAAKAAAAEASRNWVLRLAKSSMPVEVRTSAWNALRSARGDEAIAEWLAPGGGFDAAKQRIRDARTRNRLFCERVVRTHAVEFAPETRAAAERALKGSVADQAAFVKTGYAEAQKRDRAAREADVQHKLEVTAKDRDFVSSIADHDPGEQVRVAAQWALRPGATDADVVEFFGYGWMTGATLDTEAYRTRIAEAETLRHAALSRLLAEAVAAEKAAKGSADAAKARAEAERAWSTVSAHAEAARKAWLAEREAAAAQAENWKNIAKAAKASADELWKNIGRSADENERNWSQEQAEAAESAAFWQSMFDKAQAGETRAKA